MAEKKRTFEAEVIGLPPLRLVLGEVPSPDPEVRRKPNRHTRTTSEMEMNVRKIIHHLINNK